MGSAAAFAATLNSAKDIFNEFSPQTRAILTANTAGNSLAFRDPNLPEATQAGIGDMKANLNSYLNGAFVVIRNVRLKDFTDYYVYLNKLIADNTELNLPDKPGKGGFGPTGEVRNLNRPGAGGGFLGLGGVGTEPIGAGTGSGGINDPVTGMRPDTSPPIAVPTIVQGALNQNSAARSVIITHPDVSASIFTAYGTATTAPDIQYTRGSVLVIPAGQSLRAIAQAAGAPPKSSAVSTFTNVITNVIAPTIAVVNIPGSPPAATNIQVVSVTSQIPGAAIKVVIGPSTTATPGVFVANGATVNVPPTQTIRATATAGGITSPVAMYTNPLQVPSIVAPTVTVVGSTPPATNIQRVRLSHPLGAGVQIKYSTGVGTVPSINIANNGEINVNPGSTLRYNATLSGIVSPTIGYVNNLPNPAAPTPPTSTAAPTITLLSTAANGSQRVRLTTTLAGAQLKVIVSNSPGAQPTVVANNNSEFILSTSSRYLRATATVNNVTSAITTYTNPNQTQTNQGGGGGA
jgi:hypothetical protein